MTCIRVWLMVAVLLGCVESASAYTGKKLALLVGCEKYKHPDLPLLDYAEEDVLELAEVLREQGFKCTVLTHLTGRTNSKLEPTAENVRAALAKLIEKVDRDDLLVVGLAGHGMQPQGYDEPFFLPMDGNPTTRPAKEDTTVVQEFKFPETVLGIGAILTEIRESGVGQKLVIMDACRNAPLVSRNAAFTFKAVPPQTAILLSCSRGQLANESVQLKHGLFFQAVLEGLRGEAADKKGVVTLDHLAAYAKSRTREIAEEMETRQQPQSYTNLDGEPIVLARVVAKPTVPKLVPSTPTPTKPTEAALRSAGERLVVKTSGIDLQLRWCPAGSFTMGSPASEPHRFEDENQVRVTLTKGFWLGETEVTQEFYESVIGTNPAYFKGARLPVERVSWEDAVAFCVKLTERERAAGRLSGTAEYRLPTEAEWEYACRAGTTTATAFGEALSSEQANFDGEYPYNGASKGPDLRSTREVGKYAANEWGLKDMHGNVSEWCGDWYADKLKGGTNPFVDTGTGNEKRTYRGGNWSAGGYWCRSSIRFRESPGFRDSYGYIGFRCLRTE
jgi:sulfatase modifying factor 1